MKPKISTCIDKYNLGPIYVWLGGICTSVFWLQHTLCRSMFEGISSTTIPRNIIWLPKFIVLWEILISAAKPPVRALAMFIRSNRNTKSPRHSKGKTVASTLSWVRYCYLELKDSTYLRRALRLSRPSMASLLTTSAASWPSSRDESSAITASGTILKCKIMMPKILWFWRPTNSTSSQHIRSTLKEKPYLLETWSICTSQGQMTQSWTRCLKAVNYAPTTVVTST